MSLQIDSRLSFLEHAYALYEDRLSLRSRVLLTAASVDAGFAMQLFRCITPPRLNAATCQDALIPDVHLYYEAVGKIFALQRAANQATSTKSMAFQQLQEIAANTSSPVQLPLLAKILESANLSEMEFTSLLNTLAAAIEALPVDDNSFYGRNEYLVVEARVQLERLAQVKEVSSYAFTHSVHDYLQRSLRGTHCEDNEPKDLKELVTLYQSLNRRPGTSDDRVEPLSLPTSLPPIEPHPAPAIIGLARKQRNS